MKVHVKIVSAFSKEDSGGNPAAIVFDADKFSPEQKQRLAAKIGLSETAFVGTSAIADFKLDFFTPVRQIAHCGHATIATFSYLKQQAKISGNESSKETIDGRREIRFVGNTAFMEQKAPAFSKPDKNDLPLVMKSANLTAEDLVVAPVIVNTGNAFLILQVKSEEVLENLKADLGEVTAVSEKYGLIGYYFFFYSAAQGVDATTRMFAPAYGINEESATGMAAGPLACLLYQQIEQKERYSIEQGRFMNPPSTSLIQVNLKVEGEKILSLYAGGDAVLLKEIVVDVA